MAAKPQDLPRNKPRIVSIEEPSAGHYVIGVLVDPVRRKLAPDWGTTLANAALLATGDLAITPPTGGTTLDISGFQLVEIKPDDSGTNQVWYFRPLPGPLMEGQEYQPQGNMVVKYTEQLVASGSHIGDSKTTVTPISSAIDRIHKTDLDALADEMENLSFSFPTRTNVEVPPILRGISVAWDESTSAGSSESTGSGDTATNTSMSLSTQGSASTEMSATPSFVVDMEEVYAKNVLTTTHVFYLGGAVSTAAILAKVSELHGQTVYEWPVFKPESHIIQAVGKSVSVSAAASASAHASNSESSGWATGKTEGKSYSVSHRTNLITLKIPSCLHWGMKYDEDRLVAPDVSCTADITGDGTLPTAHSFSESSTSDDEITASVHFNLLPTVPPDVPRGGMFLIDSKVTDYAYGYYRVIAEVLDAEQLHQTTWTSLPMTVWRPAAPTGLNAEPADESISLTWNPVANATSYKLYRSEDSGGTYVLVNATPITGTSYADSPLANGESYFYYVTAVNAGGESVRSFQAHATPAAP